MPSPHAIVFDLGGVLIDWNPRHLYRKLFDDTEAMEHFLSEVCTPAWNAQQDAGRPFAEATALLIEQYPEHAAMIRAYDRRWEEMVAGAFEPSVAVLEALAAQDHPLYALTNWSAEKFGLMRERFAFLNHFEDILVSGEVGLKKPDPRIYDLLLERIGYDAEDCLFIDDARPNVEAARTLGFHAIHLDRPGALAQKLQDFGITPFSGNDTARAVA